MKLTLARRERAYPIPRAAVAAALLLAVLGLVAAAQPGLEDGPVLCPFRLVSGLPCPTCGLMRAAHSLLRGNVADAFATNPLDAALLLAALPALAGLWLTNRVGGISLRMVASRRERVALVVTFTVLVLTNWGYVLTMHARG